MKRIDICKVYDYVFWSLCQWTIPVDSPSIHRQMSPSVNYMKHLTCSISAAVAASSSHKEASVSYYTVSFTKTSFCHINRSSGLGLKSSPSKPAECRIAAWGRRRRELIDAWRFAARAEVLSILE